MIKLIRQSRLNHFKGSLLAFYNDLKSPFHYVAIRIIDSSLYVDVAYIANRRHSNVIRYKVVGRPFVDLYRKKNCSCALKNFVLKHVKI